MNFDTTGNDNDVRGSIKQEYGAWPVTDAIPNWTACDGARVLHAVLHTRPFLAVWPQD